MPHNQKFCPWQILFHLLKSRGLERVAPCTLTLFSHTLRNVHYQ